MFKPTKCMLTAVDRQINFNFNAIQNPHWKFNFINLISLTLEVAIEKL